MSAQPVTTAAKAYANTRHASCHTRTSPAMGKQASIGTNQAWVGNAWDEAAARSRSREGGGVGDEVSDGNARGSSGAESGRKEGKAEKGAATARAGPSTIQHQSVTQSRVDEEQSGVRRKGDGAMLPVSMENQWDDGAGLPMSMRARLLIHEQAYLTIRGIYIYIERERER